jgi:hypothetical protein
MNSTKRQNEILLSNESQIQAFQVSGGKIVTGELSYNKIQSEPAASSITFGSNYIELKVKRNGHRDWLKDARIYIAVSALTTTGGTYRRFVNAPMIYMHEGFRLMVDSKEEEYITADMVFENISRHVRSDQWNRIANDIGYNTSTSARNTAASSTQAFSLALKYLFNFFSHPVDLNSYADIRIRCYLRNSLRHCIQTDGTSPVLTFNSYLLDAEYVTVNEHVNNMSKEMVISKRVHPIYDHEYLQKDFALASGATTASLDMPELSGKNVVDILVMIRATSNINTNDTSDYTDSNIAITTFNIKSGSKYLNNLQQDVTVATEYARLLLPRMHYNGINQIINRTNPAVCINFSTYEHSNTEHSHKFNGAKDFGDIRDCKINLTFSSLAANSTATVLCRFSKLVVNRLGVLESL